MRIVATFLLMFGAYGCAPIEHARTTLASETAVSVDSRIELMSVIQLLSGYFLVSYLDSDYKRDAAEHFALCADHPAVLKFTELYADGFDFNIVPDAFIALSEPPALQPRFPLKREVVESAGGADSYAEFLALTRAFASDCRFDEFYAAHRSDYNRIIDQSQPGVIASTRSLVAYLGTPLGSTEVVLGPLLHDGGFATRFDGEGGQTIAYAFIGPSGIVEGATSFGDSVRLQPLVAHEFAHTVINPLTASFPMEVAAIARNFAPLAEAMQKEGYTSWEQVINESIIRAMTARLTTVERGKSAGESEIANEMKRGFAYVPALVAALERYEAQRHTYTTIADFYPELLSVFRQPVETLPPIGNKVTPTKSDP